MGCDTCAGGCGSGPGVALPEGLVTEILIADEGDARAIAEDPTPCRRWPGIDLEGTDQVKLATLWALLAGGRYEDRLVEAFTPLEEVSEDGPWVFRVPPPLATLLAGLEAGRAAAVAEDWACTEALELEGWEPDDVRRLLDGLRGVARAAATAGKPLLLWVGL